jgi:hypothetical protein
MAENHRKRNLWPLALALIAMTAACTVHRKPDIIPAPGGCEISEALSDPAVNGLELRGYLRDDKHLVGPHDIEVRNRLAYVAGKSGSFSIVDLESPRRPRLRASITHGFDNSQTVYLLGDTVLVAGTDLVAVDVSDPDRPITLSRLHNPVAAQINGVAAFDEHTLLAANKFHYIIVLDVSDPTRPRIEGYLDTWATGVISPHDVAIVGDHLVVADQAKTATRHIQLYRIAERGKLLPTRYWRPAGSVNAEELVGANRLIVLGDHVLVAANSANTVARIDLSNPAHPSIVASASTRGGAPCGIDLVDGMLFVGAGDMLEIFDVRGPRMLKSVRALSGCPAISTGSGRGGAHDLQYEEGFVYVTAQADSALVVFEVTRLGIDGRGPSQ